uniref:Uncharacterized protein n=1 Tax=Rhizophagus irregularis (strain DAOM 181602 / DAOM 197198 / MUCL 43194) TaxID=747089 RepID=U9TZR9_RHIID
MHMNSFYLYVQMHLNISKVITLTKIPKCLLVKLIYTVFLRSLSDIDQKLILKYFIFVIFLHFYYLSEDSSFFYENLRCRKIKKFFEVCVVNNVSIKCLRYFAGTFHTAKCD